MKRSAGEPINESFRAWTRGTSFTLQMGKTQVATLVAVAASREQFIGFGHPALRLFVTAIRGLEARGLVSMKEFSDDNPHKIRALYERWSITDAGKHVVALLKCAGIYDELKRELLAAKRSEHGYYVREMVAASGGRS